ERGILQHAKEVLSFPRDSLGNMHVWAQLGHDFSHQSGSGGGKASGSACQTRNAFPAGSAITACQAVRGTPGLGVRVLPSGRPPASSVASSETTSMKFMKPC